MMIPLPSSCHGCVLFGEHKGFVPAEAAGHNGVLVVLEAAGADEELAGVPTVGKAGFYLWSQLAKAGLKREDFWTHNVLSCKPPENRLSNQPYEAAAIAHCAPNLDRTIADHRTMCDRMGKHQVILALGRIAVKRILGLPENDPLLKEDYHGYVHRSERYDCWVLTADHPAFLMRGQHHLMPLLQFAALRAVEIASEGFAYAEPHLLLDPTPEKFAEWVGGYEAALAADPAHTYLSTDIETPRKAKTGEDALVREDDEDYIILRCSFAYREDEAVSVPWTAEYLPLIERMMLNPATTILCWNESYDLPRIKHQMEVRASNVDGMLAWHVLNSALDKRLGFVTPFYWKSARIWKQLAQREPAYYNAIDALAALINFNGIKRDLVAANQWGTFDRHVVQLNTVLNGMSAAGLMRDEVMRQQAEDRLSMMLDDIEVQIQAAVPQRARRYKVYKTKPRSLEGVQSRPVEVLTLVCPWCKKIKPSKAHFKVSKRQPNKNVCGGLEAQEERVIKQEYFKELPWKASTVQLGAYQKSLAQQAVKNRDGRATFDEDAIGKLVKKYPKDPLYPLLLNHRKMAKLLGTYVGRKQPDGRVKGGLRIGKDGAIHPEFQHNPSTLRLACQNPNMQNLPRSSKDDADLANIVRNLVVARPGHVFVEADFSGIEAVLVGYFARDKDYIRLAKLGIHAYLASHVLGRPADLAWPNDKLKKYFKEIKGSDDALVNQVYNGSKRAIHLCLTPDHEVMTPLGWVRLDHLRDHQEVLVWDATKDQLAWNMPTHVTREEYAGPMISWHGRGLSAVMTPNHRVPFVQDKGGRLYTRPVLDVPKCARIPVSSELSCGQVESWPLIQLVVAAQADSTITSRGSIQFHLHKTRKIIRLRGILNQLQFKWSEKPCKCGGVYIRVKTGDKLWPYLDQITKSFKIDALLQLSLPIRRQMLAELLHWDGNISNGHMTYSTKEQANADAAQMLAHTTGCQALIRYVYVKGVRYHIVSFNRCKWARKAVLDTTVVPYKGMVYCITVPTSYFLVRHDNRVSITGNSAYGGSPYQMHRAEPETFATVKDAQRIQDIYWSICPLVHTWQLQTQLSAHTNGHLRNPYNYIHRFTHVFRHVKEAGKWVRKPGDQANEVLAFLPQSTAAGIIKEAMLRLWEDPQMARCLRLQVHDSLLLEVPEDELDIVREKLVACMTAPVEALPLPASYRMGSHLVIDVDTKVGQRWGMMR